eukprot:6678732-Heterocapsa_arctica.AAC.1
MLGEARLTAWCRPSALPQASLLGDLDRPLGSLALQSAEEVWGGSLARERAERCSPCYTI